MRKQLFFGLALSLALLGCSSVADDANVTDASTDGPEAKPAPGGGVCCPLTATAGCSPNGHFGGWAASAAECREQSAYDGCPFVVTKDSHGCAVLGEPACTTPCGAAPDTGLPDTSSDTKTGGDVDEHGCIGSAGYQWCAKEMKCERPWELAAEKGFPNTSEEFAKYCGT